MDTQFTTQTFSPAPDGGASDTLLSTIASNTSGVATSANQSSSPTILSIIASNTGVGTSGGATAALQTSGNASLATMASSGATAALQTTGNASLATIAANASGVVTTDTLSASTIVALATAVQVKASGTRKTLDLINTGVGTIYFGFSSAVTASNGWPLAPAGSANDQGGSYSWDRGCAPNTALFVYSTAGSTVIVKEGV